MVDRVVIDASVVAKLYLRDEKWVDRADEIFDRFARGELNVLAPRLIIYEVPAAIMQATVKGRIDVDQALEAVRRFARLPLPLVEESRPLVEEAFQSAHKYGCALYDAVYLQLSEDLGWEFVTADEKLHRKLQSRVSYLVLLSQFS